MRQAPGFLDPYAIREAGGTLTLAVFIWESQADAQAFHATEGAQAWSQTVREYGSQLEGDDWGEVVQHLYLALVVRAVRSTDFGRRYPEGAHTMFGTITRNTFTGDPARLEDLGERLVAEYFPLLG